MDPLDRSSYQIVADCTPLEIDGAMYQLRDFIDPETSHLYNIHDARKNILHFVQRNLVTCSVVINFLVYEIIVTIVPGKTVSVFIRRKLPIPESQKHTEPELVYEAKIF